MKDEAKAAVWRDLMQRGGAAALLGEVRALLVHAADEEVHGLVAELRRLGEFLLAGEAQGRLHRALEAELAAGTLPEFEPDATLRVLAGRVEQLRRAVEQAGAEPSVLALLARRDALHEQVEKLERRRQQLLGRLEELSHAGSLRSLGPAAAGAAPAEGPGAGEGVPAAGRRAGDPPGRAGVPGRGA